MKTLSITTSFGMLVMLGMFSCTSQGGESRIGRYPGNPDENFAPRMEVDHTYRNIALHRAAYHSSCYDYNLTAQLVTDGILPEKGQEPVCLVASTHSSALPKREREWAIDGGAFTRNVLMGDHVWLEYLWHGGMKLKANRIQIVSRVAYNPEEADGSYRFQIEGEEQQVLGEMEGRNYPGEASGNKVHSDPNKVTDSVLLPTRNIVTMIDMTTPSDGISQLKVDLQMKGAVHWTVTELQFFMDSQPVTDILPSSGFTSTWMSEGDTDEWVYVDLGSKAQFDKVRIHWLWKAQTGRIETSDDAQHWHTVTSLPGGECLTDEVDCRGEGRYVRVVMDKADNRRFAMAELEVWGKGGLTAVATEKPQPEGARHWLNGGEWKLQRASEVMARGEEIASASFDATDWITATVPATVLMSYANIGALPDPNYDDNIFQISESFFNSNFWYRRSFVVPEQFQGKHVFLNFDGINWKADIYLNGKKIDRIEGAFMRGHTEVTDLLTDGENVLAVEIVKNAHPGAVKEKYREDTDFNGGLLGYDNPTFHATIGWDWISTIRGRDIGIWNDVYLSTSGAVSLRDPLVCSKLHLPDTTATLTPRVIVTNHEPHPVEGVLKGWIDDIHFEQPIRMEADETREVVFSPDLFAILKEVRLPLWWPVGYGAPVLHPSGFEMVIDGSVSDSIHFSTGIREMQYCDEATQLKLYVNGRRLVPLGGNWGFSENNLCYRGREYDIAVGYHKQMQFNMIRNWVGQTGDEEFYEACDRHGVMVWQDFWLANPCDGPDPMDEDMFLSNALDYVKRIRNHPCIALYCGRNEGYPPATIDSRLRNFVAQQHPGITYISSSADDGVSGHGPYWAIPAREYFERQTGKLHSERGMPNVMTWEGLSRTLRPEHLWPQDNEWGQHDYCMKGAQRGASFNEIVRTAFGEINDARTFVTLAQWVNYEGYRAMYESGSADRLGLLIWMSHACWPSMTWQCYDYYFEPTAAFFGCKKACEPLHIQWNALSGNVEVVNRSAGLQQALTASCRIMDLKGNTLSSSSRKLSCNEDSTVVCQQVEFPEDSTRVYVVKLELREAEEGALLSENTYVQPASDGSRLQLLQLPQVGLSTSCSMYPNHLTLRIQNPSDIPVFMIRLCLRAKDEEQVLPVTYSDNYFHLMPGEEKTVIVEWNESDTRGLPVSVSLSALNVQETILP